MLDILTIFVLAVGLSMDTFAVSMTAGLTDRYKIKFIYYRFAFTMGFIQALGILIGYFLGIGLEKLISEFDHWIAFSLLVIIGGKMLIEGIKNKGCTKRSTINMNNFYIVTGLWIATSIDAGIVGIGISLTGYNIILTTTLIFIITFLFSCFGLFGGKFICKYFNNFPAEIIGGIVLIILGIKVLIEYGVLN